MIFLANCWIALELSYFEQIAKTADFAVISHTLAGRYSLPRGLTIDPYLYGFNPFAASG